MRYHCIMLYMCTFILISICKCPSHEPICILQNCWIQTNLFGNELTVKHLGGRVKGRKWHISLSNSDICGEGVPIIGFPQIMRPQLYMICCKPKIEGGGEEKKPQGPFQVYKYISLVLTVYLNQATVLQRLKGQNFKDWKNRK